VQIQAGDEVTFSVRPAPSPDATSHFQVSYEAFVDDVRMNDIVMVDGGMVIVEVTGIEGPDVSAVVLEPGKVMSRATLTLRRGKDLVRGKSSQLPVVTAKDWQDIDFAIKNEVCSQRFNCKPTLETYIVSCSFYL
jgi:pyruvate kinase